MRHQRNMMQRFSDDQVKTIYKRTRLAGIRILSILQSTCIHVALATHVHIAMAHTVVAHVMAHVHRMIHVEIWH